MTQFVAVQRRMNPTTKLIGCALQLLWIIQTFLLQKAIWQIFVARQSLMSLAQRLCYQSEIQKRFLRLFVR